MAKTKGTGGVGLLDEKEHVMTSKKKPKAYSKSNLGVSHTVIFEDAPDSLDDYVHLLVDAVTGRTVAGTRSNNRQALIDAYAQNQGVDAGSLDNFVVEYGPKGLREVRAGLESFRARHEASLSSSRNRD